MYRKGEDWDIGVIEEAGRAWETVEGLEKGDGIRLRVAEICRE